MTVVIDSLVPYATVPTDRQKECRIPTHVSPDQHDTKTNDHIHVKTGRVGERANGPAMCKSSKATGANSLSINLTTRARTHTHPNHTERSR